MASLTGYAQAGQVAEAPRPPRLDGPANSMDSLLQGFQEYAIRLSRLADRLGGSVPESVEKDLARPGNACVASRYETLADDLSTASRRINAALERLESL